MYRAILAIVGMMMLTGCSELQVIGKASVRELGNDKVVSVESERYKPRTAKKRLVETRTLLAKASTQDGTVAKVERKELWRNN